MRTLRRSVFLRYVVIPLTLVAWLSGCHKWSTVATSPSDVVTEEQPDKVRVTWRGEQYELVSVEIQADSLIGQDPDRRRIAIPTGEIDRLEIRKSDAVGTTLLIVGAAAVAFGVFLIIVCTAEEIGC